MKASPFFVRPKKRFIETAFGGIAIVALTIAGVTTTADETFAQGPGTEMTKIINRVGLGSDCGRCKALATEMDQRGPEWVMQNRQYVANRTIENASRLGHTMGPAKRLGVRVMVRTAVRRSR